MNPTSTDMDVDPRQYQDFAVSDSDTNSVVLSYLVHNCYKETVESFIGCTGTKRPTGCVEDIDRRKGIIEFALNGNVLKAIELTEQLAPDLLQTKEELRFDLLSLHFLELLTRDSVEAIDFAREQLSPFGKWDKYRSKVEDFMALVAYEDPEKSPMFHLLSPEFRQDVVDNLNRAILAHTNQPSYSSLERVIQQTAVVRQNLNLEQSKDGLPPFTLKDFIRS